MIGGRDTNTRDSLCVIDGNTNSIIGTIGIDSPKDLVIDLDSNVVYIINGTGSYNTITAERGLLPENRYSLPSEKLPNINVGSSLSKITVNPFTNALYVIGDNGNAVYMVDRYTNAIVNNFTVNGEASDISVNPITDIVYVTRQSLI